MFEGSSSKRLSCEYLKQISMKLSSAVIDTKCYAILPYSGVTKCRTERSYSQITRRTFASRSSDFVNDSYNYRPINMHAKCSICSLAENASIGFSEFSRFSDLAPKLRRESKAKCKVAFLGIKNKKPW